MARGAKTWVPVAIAGGGATGALAAFWMMRREIRKTVQCPPAAAAEPELREEAAAQHEEVSPEIVAIISAAVSAFLGKTARVRGIRPAHAAAASPWSQQGRVSIQGSHILARQ